MIEPHVVTLDLSGARPLVMLDGHALHGVMSAHVDVLPDGMPVMLLKLIAFRLAEATVPFRPSRAADLDADGSLGKE